MKKRIITIIVFALLIGLAYTHDNYKNYKKGRESFFDKIPDLAPYEVEQAKKKMYDDFQELKIEDYTITLDKVCYSREKISGWCRFAVTREGKNMENEIGVQDLEAYFDHFGENRRFEFSPATDITGSCTGRMKSWYKVEDDVMYIYFYNTVSDTNTYNHCIYLFDTKSGRVGGDHYTEEASGVFELREDTDIIKCEYQTKEDIYNVTVSPYTININGSKKLDTGNIKIHLNNKEVLAVKENGDICEGIGQFGEYIPDEEGYIKTYSYILGFAEPLDIAEVDYVEIDGNKVGNKTSDNTEISKDSDFKNHQYDDLDIDEISWLESGDESARHITDNNQQIYQLLELLKGLELEETKPEVTYGVSNILELYQDSNKVAAVVGGTYFEIGDKVYIAKNAKQADVLYEINRILKDI